MAASLATLQELEKTNAIEKMKESGSLAYGWA